MKCRAGRAQNLPKWAARPNRFCMKRILTFAAALGLVTTSHALAQETDPQSSPTPIIHLTQTGEVTSAVWRFFKALRSDDKTALADHMDASGMITIHNRMDPSDPKIVFVPVSQHLENWLGSPQGLDERMFEQTILIDGDMAQVWGPYRFTSGGKTTHCGINSFSLVNHGDGWKVANTSFTMEQPSECERLGAPAERSK